MSTFCTLFSGSSGNSAFISDGRTNLLIDAGVSASRICEKLAEVGCSPYDIHGILLTHEHRDHISGVGVLSRNYSIPVYGTASTLDKTMPITGWIYDDYVHSFSSDEKFNIGNIEVFPFSIPHDASDPVGYTFRFHGQYYSIATDMGCITDLVLKHLCRSEAVILESNHDIEMLKNGPYPYHLKNRILGAKGHLSNDTAAHFAAQLVKWGTKRICLGHLSEKNNTTEAAYTAVANCFLQNGIDTEKDVKLFVAPKDGVCHI